MYEGWIGLFIEVNGVWKWSTDSGKHGNEENIHCTQVQVQYTSVPA